MAHTQKILNIDVNSDIPDIIAAKQEDANSRYLDVRLTDNGIPINLNKHTVRIRCLKPDGHRIFNNCEITDAQAGRFQAELTNQVLAIPGKVEVEFTLYGDNETRVLTTKTFNIVVLKNLYDEEAVESTNEFGAAAILFQDVAAIRGFIIDTNKLVNQYLDVTVSSRATQVSVDNITNMLKDGTITGGIKRVQRGIFEAKNLMGEHTVAISAVNPAKSFVTMAYLYTSSAYSGGVSVRLSPDGKSVIIQPDNGIFRLPISWEVVEFY